MYKHRCVFFFLLSLLGCSAWAQQDSIPIDKSFELNLRQDVLNLTPQRAFGSTSNVMSGVEEDNFTVPAPVYVLTREEMERSGVLSLAEAFRLIPGCMVRERSKGNFDISLTNTSYLLKKNADFQNIDGNALTILVNGIPIIQRERNSIWWESLPNISSIDQIEIILSPSVAIYGISSVGGVINIRTRKMSLDRLKVVADGSIDHRMDVSMSTYMESAISDKVKANLTFDYRNIRRPFTEYYLTGVNQYLEPDQAEAFVQLMRDSLAPYEISIPEFGSTTPDVDISTKAMKVQSMVEYYDSKDLSANLLIEYLNSQAQTSLENQYLLFMTGRENSIASVTASGNYKKLRLSSKFGLGERNFSIGNPGYHYSTRNLLTKADYLLKLKHMSFRPGVFFNYSLIQTADGSKEDLSVPPIKTNFNSLGLLNVFEFGDVDKIRLTSSQSMEYFSELNEVYYAVDASVGYKVSKDLFFRSSLGYTYQSPNIERYIVVDFSMDDKPTFNQALKPVRVTYADLGLRTKPTSFFEGEMNLFYRFYTSFQDREFDAIKGAFIHVNNDININNVGITLNSKFRFEKMHLRAFCSVLFSPSSETTADIEIDNQPTVWGGISANYTAWLNRLNFNFLLYINGAYDLDYYGSFSGQYPSSYKQRAILVDYFKVSYRFLNESYLYLSTKNLFGGRRVEYPFGDYIPTRINLGLRFNFITK